MRENSRWGCCNRYLGATQPKSRSNHQHPDSLLIPAYPLDTHDEQVIALPRNRGRDPSYRGSGCDRDGSLREEGEERSESHCREVCYLIRMGYVTFPSRLARVDVLTRKIGLRGIARVSISICSQRSVR